ncbi:hypothetical protein BJ165DRAFT_933873 [Panaeolus papilionaceus]|nr:hypothetical protein BJ165DRAFT_933873 [Panaeolus papilionaceus]
MANVFGIGWIDGMGYTGGYGSICGVAVIINDGNINTTRADISVNVNASGSDGGGAGAGGSSAMPAEGQRGSAEGFFSLQEMGMGAYIEEQGMEGREGLGYPEEVSRQHQQQGQQQGQHHQPQHQRDTPQNQHLQQQQQQQHQLSLQFPSFVYAPSGPPMLIPGGRAEVVPLSSDAWCRWNGFQPLSLGLGVGLPAI